MFEGLFFRDAGEVLQRSVAKWATRCGEPDLFDLRWSAAAHGLVNGVVFGVDGQECDVVGSAGG